MTSSRFRRRRRERRLALADDFPDTGETVTEILDRARPPDCDGTTIEWGGASSAGLPDDAITAIYSIAAVAVKERGRDTQPLARLRARGQQPTAFPVLPPAGYGLPALPPARPQPEPDPGPEPPVLAAVPVTEPARIGDELRLPVIWCEAAACITWRHDPEALGEADARQRAIAAGWRADAFGRLTCPACQQRDPAFRATRPLAWHHWEVARRWHENGENLGEQDKDKLAATAEYCRRINREDPALARDLAGATQRHEQAAHGARHRRHGAGAR